MSVGKGFASGFGGCLGIGCAIVLVSIIVPISCISCATIASKSVTPVQDNTAEAKRRASLTPAQRAAEEKAATEAETKRKAAAERESHPIDLVVSDAAAVYAAFDRNEVQADNDMKNKWFAVKGKIQKIGKDILNTPYVAVGNGERYSIFCVQCMFTDGDEAALAELQPGQAIVIAGKCAGKFGNVL